MVTLTQQGELVQDHRPVGGYHDQCPGRWQTARKPVLSKPAEVEKQTYQIQAVERVVVVNLEDQARYNLEGDGDTGSGVLLHRRQCASGGLGYGGELVELQDNDVLLQREGWTVDHQRVYRRYCQEGLILRTKKPRRYVSVQRSMERPVAAGVDEAWPMDFMSDELFDGRRNWFLTIADNFTRESLAIPILTCPVAASIKRAGVVEVLHQLMRPRRLPQTIRVDNGPEFTSQCLD